MKIIAVLILGAVVATAFADHKDEPVLPNMPNLKDMMGGKMPQIPPGMKLDDLKDAFYNMPPAMKAKLNDMAESMGVKYDDIEDALNNPPKQMRDMFEKNNADGQAGDGMFNIPQPEGQEQSNEGPGLDIADMLQNIDMGAMGDMLKNVDVNSIMQNMDLGSMGDMMKNVDIGGLMKNMDLGSMGDMMKNVDMNIVNGLMKNMDLGAMGDMMKNVDIGGLMKNMDLGGMGDIMKNVDIGGLMKNMDLGAMGGMMKNVDIGGLMKNMDLGAMGDIMKNVDIGGLMKNMDLGPMGDIMKNVDIAGLMKNMDLGSMGNIMKNVDMGMISGLMKDMDMGPIGDIVKNIDFKSVAGLMNGKMPSLGAVKSMVGIPEDASLGDMKDILRNKMDKMGIPTDNPIEALGVISDKIKQLPLPEGMDISPMLNQLHGQLEAMGMPDDPSQIRGFVMEKLGLPADIKSIDDLKEPGLLMKVMRNNAFKMLGLDESEDTNVVMDRIVEQLREEAEKMGANLPKDASKEQMMTEADKILSKKLGEITGLDTKSIMPMKLYAAAKDKLKQMGMPIGDFGSMKKNLMSMIKKQVMKKVVPMMMHMVMPKRRHQMPQQMPQQMPRQMPPQMPPQMMMMPHGPMIPINLDIEVNVEQPQQQQTMPPQIPSYLRGVEHAVHHEGIEELDDEQLFHHIMAVREGLRSGEMAEEVLQEMIEDLMNARLRARVLSVRNMFLTDRLAAMEREMGMMKAAEEPVPPMRSQSGNPLLKALLRPRVL